MMTKVKICGFTNAENAREVALLGIDAIGLNFYSQSPRFVDIATANTIVHNLPPFVSSVGLFVNADYDYIDSVLSEVSLDTLQFHGSETRAECEQYGLPYIKSVAMDEMTHLAHIAEEYYNASALLLDTPSVQFGGSGKAFNWELITQIEMPIILAGGLDAQNVRGAIERVHPYAVDTASGVESEKGIKDIAKVQAFLQAVRFALTKNT